MPSLIMSRSFTFNVIAVYFLFVPSGSAPLFRLIVDWLHVFCFILSSVWTYLLHLHLNTFSDCFLVYHI